MRTLVLVLAAYGLLWPGPGPRAATYYVATDGSTDGDGSELQPWPTVHYAIRQVQGGDTIVVKDGEYQGYTSVQQVFDDWVTVRAEHPYRAVLGHPFGDSEVLLLLGARKVIFEDLVFSNIDPDHTCDLVENNWLVHFQQVQEVVFRNNIVFGNQAAGACNNLLSINRSTSDFYPKDVQITGNLFYGVPDIGGTSLIYLNTTGEIDITENIFFGHDSPRAYFFVELYKEASWEDAGLQPRSPRFVFARNIFLNWQGVSNAGFIQIGQGWDLTNTVRDVLIENNLMIGNSASGMIAPVQIRNGEGLTLRANTVVGDLPSQAYGAHLFYEGIQVSKKDIFLRNNIWSDPTGTMGDRLIDYRTDVIDPQTVNLVLDHNLYHNAGNPLPALQAPAPADDPNGVFADPGLAGDHSGLVLPVWDITSHSFTSGSATIREEFERLVHTYGAIGEQSPAVGAADPANMPADDILGRQRDPNPDMGAFEWVTPQPDAGTDGDGSSGGDSETTPGRVVLRAGEQIPAGRLVAPGESQVVLRLELESHHANGRLSNLTVRLPGLEQADDRLSRLQLLLQTDPEGDGLVGPSSVPVGGGWVQEGQVSMQVSNLQFTPGAALSVLVQLGVQRVATRQAGSGAGLWWLLLPGLWWLLRRRPGLRVALMLGIVLLLFACTRYGFKPTIFETRLVIESADDVEVSPQLQVDLEPTPLEGGRFKVSL